MGRFWGVLLRRCIAAILPLIAAGCRCSGKLKGNHAAGAAKLRHDCFLTEFKTSSGKLSEPGLWGLRDGQDFGVGLLNCDCGDVE